MLTAAFTASVAVYSAQAQHLKHREQGEDKTNQAVGDTVYNHNTERHTNNFFRLFRRKSKIPNSNQGFGNTAYNNNSTAHS